MEQHEWDELLQIREEMNANMMALDAPTQEKYVRLLVKSLEGKGNMPVGTVSRPAGGG